MIRIVFLLLTLSTLLSATCLAEDYGEVAGRYRSLARNGSEATSPQVWRDLSRSFAKLQQGEGRVAEGDKALYMAGLCAERAAAVGGDEADLKRAVGFYLTLANLYAQSNLADDGLYKAAEISAAGSDYVGAKTLFARLAKDFAEGDMAVLARARLKSSGVMATVKNIRHWAGPQYSRLVIDLDRAATFVAKKLSPDPANGKPFRIYVDLKNASTGGHVGQLLFKDSLLSKVRTGQFDPETVRVVFDLTSEADFRVFPLSDPHRVVVDLMGKPETDRVEVDLVAKLIRERVSGKKTPEVRSKRFKIVIDPGHGGKDPGALGSNGLKEKDVVLALSRELKRALIDKLDCDVLLTRDDDRYIRLDGRTAIANRFGADLFISVHANANRSRRARGIETYFLDRASDKSARKLAAKENAGSEEGLAQIEHILADVLLNNKMPESRRLATAVQSSLIAALNESYGQVKDLGVKRAPFYVLTGAVMPAILVEAGFISNPTESRRLANPDFRRSVAEALSAGVENYVKGS